MIKNALLKRLAKHKTTKSQQAKRILVVSTTGLGDTLWGTPAIRAIKRQRPDCFLAVLTSPIGSQVLKNSPYIDELICVSDPLLPSTAKLIASLKRKNFDTALIFHTSQRLILPICVWSQINTIIGTSGINKGLDDLLSHATPPQEEHEIARRLRITQAIGIENRGAELDWFINHEEKSAAEKFLLNFTKPLIGLHPGAKDRFKQWPPEHFISVGQSLAEEGFQVLVTGNALEKPLAAFIANKIPGAKSIAGELNLRNFAATLSHFCVFITNDTGPMHMAFAVKTPTLALFGPTDPKKCGPYHVKQAHILSKPPTCKPCLKKSCLDPFCMRQIGPKEVMTHVKRFYIGDFAHA